MATDYRALCAELLVELENAIRVIYREDGTHHISAADAVIARADTALAAEADGPAVQSREPASVIGEPSDEELLGIAADCFAPVMVHFARAVLARWGRPAPVPAEGEVAELVAWLRDRAAGNERFGAPTASAQLTRAADLLEQRHPAPVPVSERLPGPEDCDAEGRCWWWYPPVPEQNYGYWIYEDNAVPERSRLEWPDSWLPATALPLPQGEAQP